MRPPLLRWLSFRVQVLCVLVFIGGTFLPPYVPRSALASDDLPVSSQQFLFVEEGFLMKSSSLGTQGSRLAYGEGLIHKVKDGESVLSIAKQYDISAQTILWANNLTAKDSIKPGKELVILPVDGVLHTVKSGQTLTKIAQTYAVAQEDIVRQNHIRNGLIVAGQQLIIPGGKPQTGETAPTLVATADGLRFGDSLSAKDIKLRLELSGDDNNNGGGGSRAIAPSIGAGITATVLQWPCQGCSVTQYFNASHFALDIQTKGGGPIYAAADGVVIRADHGWNGGYGNVIEVDHGNGLVTLYGHNKELYVKDGDHVKRGEKISWMGNTGLVHGPTGIHVHFEVRVNGVKKNPLLYLE